MAAARVVLIGLFAFPVKLPGLWRTAADLHEILGDFDRVLHENHEVDLEVVEREADVLLEASSQISGSYDL